MKRWLAFTVIALCAAGAGSRAWAAEVSADSTRGAQVFELQGCSGCHVLNGVDKAIGPDLGRIADRGFTPASLAATMWNHAPAMWVETKLRSVARPTMDEQQATDLFAFFYSLRFFEEPGDAGRGKTLFTTRKCANCHGPTAFRPADPKPIDQWTVPGDPLELVETMWNHSTAMRAEMARNNIALPRLSGQELADLLVYVRSVQKLPRRQSVFRAATAEEGKGLFESKTCITCHQAGSRFFAIGARDETLTDIAADMWNHGRDMNLKTVFEPGQMRAIASYIWSRRLTENYGKASAGARVFAAKKCAVCHDDKSSGAPALAATTGFSAAGMLSALTRHGPSMLDRMREKRLAWPHFSAGEMTDLIAYLNVRDSRNGR
jgi:mono/diheme cytochrome c family protein